MQCIQYNTIYYNVYLLDKRHRGVAMLLSLHRADSCLIPGTHNSPSPFKVIPEHKAGSNPWHAIGCCPHSQIINLVGRMEKDDGATTQYVRFREVGDGRDSDCSNEESQRVKKEGEAGKWV